jgi:hypothetical protein
MQGFGDWLSLWPISRNVSTSETNQQKHVFPGPNSPIDKGSSVEMLVSTPGDKLGTNALIAWPLALAIASWQGFHSSPKSVFRLETNCMSNIWVTLAT